MKNHIERFLKRKSVRDILGDHFILNEKQVDRLLFILDDPRKVKQLEDWLPTIAHFVKNDLTNYAGRLRRLRQLPASPNLYSFVLRYGKAVGLRRYKETAQKRTSHLDTKMDTWIRAGFTKDEAIEQVRRIQAERGNRAAQVIKGTSEYSVRSIAYWLKQGLSYESAQAEVKRIQTTNGIEAYSRYGEDAERMQSERNSKWLGSLNAKPDDERSRIKLARTHSIEGCLARGLSQDEAEQTSIAYFAKRNNVSRISQMCFSMVVDRLGTSGLYYKTLNYEKQLAGKNVDLFDSIGGTVIEFLGDFWHANPLVYDQKFLIYQKPACHVIQDDKMRFSKIENHSSVNKVYVVWESEFRHNPTEVVDFIVQAILIGRQHDD